MTAREGVRPAAAPERVGRPESGAPRPATSGALPGVWSWRAVAAVVAVYAGVLAVVVPRHVYWRDEPRALSIATDLPSVGAILGELHIEGHPVLWYLLLRGASALVGPSLALPLVSALVGIAAAAVFLRFAPFGPGLKIAFTFSMFPLFEYAIVARNYGISMLLLWLLAASYARRDERPLIVGALLALLANTNVHSAALAASILLAWAVESWARRGTMDRRRWRGFAAGAALALAGIAFCAWTAYPPPNTTLTDARGDPLARLAVGAAALLNPGSVFERLFKFEELVAASDFAWATRATAATSVASANVFFLAVGIWLLRRRRALALAFIVVLVAYTIFFAGVYSAHLRHQGLIVIFAVALVWIAWRGEQPARAPRPAPRTRWDQHFLVGTFAAAFLFHDVRSVVRIRKDFARPHSSSREVAEWLRREPEYADAILMGEPSYFLEAIPYYAPNQLYMHRERAFRDWARFVRGTTGAVSAGTLLDRAHALQQSTRRPVLIVLGFHEPNPHEAGEIEYYRDSFVWTVAEGARWVAETRQVAKFDRSYEEKLQLFALR